jgi:hypothetical protein
MVTRIWHGTTHAAKSDEYLNLMRTVAIPDYRSTPGNKGAYALRRMEGDTAHFLMQTPHRFRSKRQLWTYSGVGVFVTSPAEPFDQSSATVSRCGVDCLPEEGIGDRERSQPGSHFRGDERDRMAPRFHHCDRRSLVDTSLPAGKRCQNQTEYVSHPNYSRAAGNTEVGCVIGIRTDKRPWSY